jgi:uncharacterized membrane protein
MEPELILPVLMRWTHILSAVVVAGSILFYVLVYRRAVAGLLSEEDQEKLRWSLMKKWKLFLHPPILLFLVSGFYMYIVMTKDGHPNQPIYHMIFGIKFLLALVVFALFIILTSTMNWSAGLRNKPGLWALLTILVLIVVMLGGVMRVLPLTNFP